MYIKLKADQLFTGHEMLDGDHVLILSESGRVEDIVPVAEAGDDIQFFHGILSPGFVNAHCHLELSYLKGVIAPGNGLLPFLNGVMTHRKDAVEQMQEHLEKAEQECLNNGIVAVGDICNTDHTLALKQKNKLHYFNFLELAGLPEVLAEDRYQSGLNLRFRFNTITHPNAITPHAPYSVSHKLAESIEKDQANSIISIHNQETPEENEWYQYKTGGFADFFRQWNIPTDSFTVSGKSSLQTWLPMMDASKKHILVHNLFTTEEDILAAQAHFADYPEHLIFCFCPRANIYIQNQLPDVNLFIKHGCRLVIGTDSLASNQRLSLYEEMMTLQQAFPDLSITQLLNWATHQGAVALNMHDQLGSFEKGKKPGVVNIHQQKANAMVRTK